MAAVWTRPGYTFRAGAAAAIACADYGSGERFAAEQATLFRPGSSGLVYLGHDLLLPGKGYRRADGDTRVLLTRDGDGGGATRALANLCSHALRPLVADDAFVDRSCITCPFHHWSYRHDGSLMRARDFASEAADEACLALAHFELLTWRGFHFAVDPARRREFELDLARLEQDLVDRGLADCLDFSDWTLVATEDTPYAADWKTFMEVYGDCYHVPAYHDGLASFADCGTLEWTFGEHFHMQFLRMSAERGGRSRHYAEWVRGLGRYHERRAETMPDWAVVWAVIYPNLMIELYQGMRAISVVLPTSAASHVNRVHYFVPLDLETHVPGLGRTMKAAYDETALADEVLVQARHDGVRAARSLGLDVAPYHPNLAGRAPEAGTVHFHDWYRRALGPTAG